MGKLGRAGFRIALFLTCLSSLVTAASQPAALARRTEPAAGAIPAAVDDAPPPPRVARFDRISTGDGLPDDVVYSILQDRQGFMWFGTGNGLARYDGTQFTVYRNDPGDPTSLSDDQVYALLQARNGDLWIGTGRGVDRFDLTTKTFTHSALSAVVTALCEDELGILWVGTRWGLTHLDPANPGPSPYYRAGEAGNPLKLSGVEVHAITQDRDGNLWLGTGVGTSGFMEGGLDRFDRPSGEFVHYRHDPGNPSSLGAGDVWAIVHDRRGDLWVGTDDGLSQLDSSTETFSHYRNDPDDPSSLADGSVLKLLEDGAGRLWIGTTEGLDVLDQNRDRFVHYRHDPGDAKSLSSDVVLALYEDRSGVMWIGTTAGVSRYDETASQFAIYRDRPDSPYRLSDDTVLAVVEDRNGELWVGTAEGGLNRLDREAGTVTVYRHDPANPASLSSDGVTALYEDHAGDLWVATDNRWLERWDPTTGTFIHYWYLSAGQAEAITEDEAGDLWIGTPNGLYRLDRAAQTATHYRSTAEPALSYNAVTSLLWLPSGWLLVGTDGGGVSIWDPDASQFGYYIHDPADPKSLSHNAVYSFYEDPGRGVVWAGTWRGLDRVEYASGADRHYTEADGLSGNAVLGIRADSAGMLWLVTNRGLSRFDPRTETFRSYGAQDGLPVNLFVRTAVSQSQSGEILVGSSNGLVAFFPERLPENPHPPPVAITALGLFNEVIRRDLQPDERIELSYKENFLSFEFAALDYTAPEKNQYAYRLEGVDADWVQAGTRRRADYPNLSPGRYTFRVKAANDTGVWNEEGTAVRIVLAPPPWGTWWFRGIVLLAVAGAMLGAYGFRVRSIQMRSRELERQVAGRTAELSQANVLLEQEMAERRHTEEALAQERASAAVLAERNRLARGLHDSVTQSTYGMMLYAEAASQLLAAGDGHRDQVTDLLDQLRDTAKEGLAEMRLLIFELRPPILKEEGLASALQARLESVESRAGLAIEFRLETEAEPTDRLDLPSEIEEGLYHIAREALNNVLKHARAHKVAVTVRHLRPESVLVLNIVDDGVGFSPTEAPRRGGMGLTGMAERAVQLGAELEIESAPGAGTTVRVTLALPEQEPS